MTGSASRSDPKLEPLLPDSWRELSPLVDAVLDAAPERRAALIVELCAGDADRQRALEQLVADCERDMPLLDRPAAERFDQLAIDSPDCLLPELVADRYRTGRELGRGGMARVYLARDLKHGRDVAIKVIRPELSASLGHDRFLREIEIAARLRHPNIVPLYDSGEVGGSLFFVMPHEEGPSLRERLSQDGALPIGEAMSVLRDIARALAYAHEHGVVHRDVKPDNVMLSGDAAVVTDFGIAKAVSAALTDSGAGQTLTQTGAAIGTPAYMAPEQAVGDPSTDHRADIYAFGCLAYELFAGTPPFHGRPTHEIIAAHVGTVPPPVTTVRSDVPPFVADLIARCLEKSPDARPQSARDLLNTFDVAATTGSRTPPPEIVAAPRPVRRPWLAILTLGVAVVATAAYFVTRSISAAPITLVVVPFGNTAADTAMDAVATVLADEVASVLGRVPGIQIKSRIGARAYRGQLSVRSSEVGAKLNADYVMQGSIIRQDAGQWILSAVVERAADGAVIWDNKFTVSRDEQTGAAESIARSVIDALQKRFPKSVASGPARAFGQTKNTEAYGLYIQGRDRLSRRGQNVMESVRLFEAAVRLDTMYAPAYSGLSMALALSPLFPGGGPANEVYSRIVSAAQRALAINPDLSQPHVALGMAYQHDFQWERATAEFKTAIRLDPRDVEARIQYARHLHARGRRPGESMDQLRVARVDDPASAVVRANLSNAFVLDNQLDSALAENRKALLYEPNSYPALGIGSYIRLANNLPREARALADSAPEFPTRFYVIARSGDTVTARRLIRELEAKTPRPWMANTKLALGYLGLGEAESALRALEAATDAKEIWASNMTMDHPVYALIRQTARFRALLKRVNLVP